MEGDNNKKAPEPYKRMEFEDRDDNKNFYDQFDRESPLFHRGDMTPVPYDQIKIPEAMPNEFPEGYDPNAPQKPDPSLSDPECIQIIEAMGAFRDLKKHWAKVSDSLVAKGQILEKAGKTDELFVDEKIRKEIKDADEFQAKYESNPLFTGFKDAKQKVLDFIEKIGCSIPLGKDESKREITTFTRLLFKNQNEMMAKLKARKKVLSG